MAEYAAVKGGSLNLKRSKGSSVFKKKKRKKGSEEIEQWMKEPGAVKHGERERERECVVYIITGKWRKIRSVEEMKDRVVLEMYTGQYLLALVGWLMTSL